MGLATAVVVLFAVTPFVAFLDANRSQVQQAGRVGLYAAVVAGLSVVALHVATRVRRADPITAAAVIATVVTSFFTFGAWLDPNPTDGGKRLVQLLVWLLVTGLVCRLVVLVARASWFPTAAVVFGAVLAGVPTVGYVLWRLDDEPTSAADVPRADLGDVEVPEDRPNVYWFMLDGYARADQLERQLGLDNAPFLADLADRGFQVSTSSRSSYPRTHLSVSSTLQMTYTALPGNEIADQFGQLGSVVLGDNATVDRFHDLGYQYVYSYAGAIEWSACRTDLADVCLPVQTPGLPMGELELTLLDLTPLGSLANPSSYTDPVFVADEVGARVGDEIEEPFFLFSHILSPHWPYRFDEDCEPRTNPRDYRGLTTEEQQAEYRTQVDCLNELMLDAIDEILARDPGAVIVIQSDHGTSFNEWEWDELPFDQWSADSLNDRYRVLNALRLPEGCDQEVEGQPLVNTFRLVFACIEGRDDIEMLDYRAFIAPLDDVTAVEELEPDRFGP
jgi:hypothetical protein